MGDKASNNNRILRYKIILTQLQGVLITRDENPFLQKDLKVRRVRRESKRDKRHLIFDLFMDIT